MVSEGITVKSMLLFQLIFKSSLWKESVFVCFEENKDNILCFSLFGGEEGQPTLLSGNIV